MIKFLKMDITTAPAPALILHGVNCQSAMGAGAAKALYIKWPRVRKDYKSIPKDDMILGKVQIVPVEDNLYVLNCFTQKYYGRVKKRYANPDAIRTSLEQACLHANAIGFTEIYMTPIGCSLAGLELADDLMPIVHDIQINYPNMNFYICMHDRNKKG